MAAIPEEQPERESRGVTQLPRLHRLAIPAQLLGVEAAKVKLMKTTRFFTLEGPLCAIEDPGARTTVVCPTCGRGKRSQTGVLSVSLVCGPREVWLTDSNAVLVAERLAKRIKKLPGLELEQIHARWQEGIPGAMKERPPLCQVRARHEIHASPQNLERDDCSCGAVRRISFSPLIVLPPSQESALAWYLAESPDALILSEIFRDLLASASADLEFAEVIGKLESN
jgi:hypothetical protein